jgi:truncated hemoglobin YjbI
LTTAEAALELIVEASYQLAADDEKLAPFSEGINMDLVHTHQVNPSSPPNLNFNLPTSIPQVQFLRAALSAGQFGYPDRPIRLARLFRGGLDETHFDLFLGHVVTALREFLPEELVAETVQTVLPLRTFFQQEGLRHRGSNQGEGAKRIARRAGQ